MVDNDAHGGRNNHSASSSVSRPSKAQRRTIFSVPEPVKRVFDRFPLVTYQANELPQRSSEPGSKPILYIFSTATGVRKQELSFNPGCLKWQAYLTFAGIKFAVKSSNNHASPSGSLPFLIPAPTCATDTRSPIPSTRIQKWAKDQGRVLDEPESMRYEAYLSLLDYRIRHAWLYTLYLEEQNFNSVARRWYIEPCSSNGLVRATLAYQLQQAAKEELHKHTSVIDGDEILLEAKLAFEALSQLLGQDEYFFGAKRPGLFDASVFAYSHLLLDSNLGWINVQLAHRLRKSENIVNHRERILDGFFRKH